MLLSFIPVVILILSCSGNLDAIVVDDSQCPQRCSCNYIESNCNGLKLTSIPSSFDHRIKTLNMSNNQLERVEIPENLCQFDLFAFIWKDMKKCRAKLLVLDLKMNLIRDMNSTVFNGMDSLQEIILSINQIEEVPDSLFAFSSVPMLERVDLSQNQLKTIHPDAFKNQTSLRILHLEKNDLERLNFLLFRPLVNLKELYLADNKLVELSESLFINNGQLLSLNLDGNSLSRNSALFGLEGLQRLSLKHNQFTAVPSLVLRHLTQLEALLLDGNPLKTLNVDAFADNSLLRNLSVSNTSLTALPMNLRNLVALSSLQASFCQIGAVESGMFPLDRHFSEIDLRNNRLSYLNSDVFNFTLIDRIDLSENPWYCDCFMYRTATVLVEELQSGFLCALPKDMKGQNVIDAMKSLDYDTCSPAIFLHHPKYTSSGFKPLRVMGIVSCALIPLLVISIITLYCYRNKHRCRRPISHEIHYQQIKVADNMDPETSSDDDDAHEMLRIQPTPPSDSNQPLGEDRPT